MLKKMSTCGAGNDGTIGRYGVCLSLFITVIFIIYVHRDSEHQCGGFYALQNKRIMIVIVVRRP